MRLTTKKLHALRSGQSVWRTLIWFHTGKPTVAIEHVQLKGAKVQYPLFKDYPVPKIGKNFLTDLHGNGCFDTSRSAERFKREVEEMGFHIDIVRERRERLSAVRIVTFS